MSICQKCDYFSATGFLKQRTVSSEPQASGLGRKSGFWLFFLSLSALLLEHLQAWIALPSIMNISILVSDSISEGFGGEV